MGKVTIEKTAFGSWGNCVRMSNGEIELYATLDFGPRVIRYATVGGGNMMKEDPERSISNKDLGFGVDCEDAWYIYGGHRLWTSPEGMPRSYYPDNEPVELFIENENTIRLVPKPQKKNNLQMEMILTMDENGFVRADHNITNLNMWEITFAPWTLTVLSQGGLEIVPQPDKDTGLLGNRILALWPYTDMGDSRVTWMNRFTALRQDPNATTSFKFGLNNEKQFAAYFNHGDLFIKRYTHLEDGVYPDFGVSFETFTNQHFIEMETLGELQPVAPGETVSHTENWELYKGVACPEVTEEAIEAALKPYQK